jgi:hypothetical protein
MRFRALRSEPMRRGDRGIADVEKPPCRKLTPNIHSSHDLNRPEAKRFRAKLTNLNIPKIDLVEVFIDLLEAERTHGPFAAFDLRKRLRSRPVQWPSLALVIGRVRCQAFV